MALMQAGSRTFGLMPRHAAARCSFTSTAALAKQKLVILGTGWAGYRLLSDVDKKRYDVSVISDRPDFTFTPLLAGASVGTLEYRTTLESVHQYASKSTYYQAWAEDIDFKKQIVTCTPAVDARNDIKKESLPTFQIPYDKLVIAVGAYSQTFGIPGVKEHASFLKTVADAQYIRGRIHRCFEQANLPTTPLDDKRKLLHFCCVGGGPTGIEFAAELHDLITTDMSRAFPNIYKFARVTVFETGERVLNAFDAKLGGYASKQFEREGISIRTSHTVTKITEDTIETKEEDPVSFGLCVWSTGLAANPLVSSLKGVKKEPKTSSLLTDHHCRVLSENGEAMSNVFAIGDAAIIDGLLLPATAQVADQKAQYLGKTFNAQVKGKAAEDPFHFKDRGVMAYIGGWQAILQTPEPGEEGNFHISGKAAWFLWRSAYLAKTLSIRNKILVAYFWFFNWAFSRSLSQY